MNILYCRVSILDQKTDRQKVNERDFNYTVEDKCSGAIPFFERPVGKETVKLMANGNLTTLAVVPFQLLVHR